MRQARTSFILCLICLGLFSCEKNRWQANTDQIDVNLDWQRFDLELFDASNDGFSKEEVLTLNQKYPQLFLLYAEGVMGFDSPNSKDGRNQLSEFTNNKDINGLYQDVANYYDENSLGEEIKQLEGAFKNFKFYFPQNKIPVVRSFVSGFKYNIITNDSLLGIGLDMYLGKDYQHYPHANIPMYKFKNFKTEFMVSDAMKAWLLTEFEPETGATLLNQIIYQGKVLYLLNAFFPEAEPHIYLNYEASEIEWCLNNEKEIWFHLVDMNLLYTTELDQVRKFMGDTPFIPGFPEGSPGRVGQWLGFQIVKSFMDNNDIGLADLMAIEDANQLFQQSKYKPKQ